MTIDDIVTFARIIATSQTLLLATIVLFKHPSQMGILLGLNALGISAYLLLPLTGEGLLPLDLLATSVPSLLWLLARAFFDADRQVPIWFWLYWLTYLLLWFVPIEIENGISEFVFRFLPQLMKLGLVLHVVYLALEGRRDDLVEQRLKLRVPIAIALGLTVTIVIVTEIWLDGPAPPSVELVWSLALVGLTFLCNSLLLNLRGDLPLIDTRPKSPVPAQSITQSTTQSTTESTLQPTIEPEDTETQSMVQNAMAEGRFYATHGATIRELSEQLQVPEYRLRQVINRQMGYQNFNRLLNEHRIAEASDRLRVERDLPIISIALDVGFKSLSSFNKAFRDTHHCTPTEYRKADE